MGDRQGRIGRKGDHLVVRFGVYTHHGIDMGDGRVIHFGQGLHDKVNARVEITTRREFCNGQPIRIARGPGRYSPDQIIARGISQLDQSGYDLWDNNCEHFVNWCRTGRANSCQINTIDSVYRRTSATFAKIAVSRMATKMTTRLVDRGNPLNALVGRSALAASLVGDIAQLSTEFTAIRSGIQQDRVRQIGRSSGALASGGTGFMLAGLVGAAVGVGSWLFGEWAGLVANPIGSRRNSRDSANPDRPLSQFSATGRKES